MRLLVWVLVALAACAHSRGAERGAASAQTVISLRDLSCQSCGEAVARLLERREGVAGAVFDRKRAEVAVRYEPGRTTPDKLVAAVHEAGYAAEPGPGRGAYSAEVVFPDGLDVHWISEAGEDVDIETHRAHGKVTVIDFYATWCGPCRDVDRELLSILRDDAGIALRKVNIVDWDSPVARHYLAKAEALPYVVVFGPGGYRTTVAGLHLDALRAAIAEARAAHATTK